MKNALPLQRKIDTNQIYKLKRTSPGIAKRYKYFLNCSMNIYFFALHLKIPVVV